MKIGFYAFTGTGNTRRVCQILAKELEELGVASEVNLVRAQRALPSPDEYDALVAAFPVHGFNAPTAMLDFLKELPVCAAGNEKPVWILRVSGEPLGLNHAAGILPKRILHNRGYAVKGEFAYVMPYNIIFRHSDGMAARMYRAAKLLAYKDARAIVAGEGKLYFNGPFRRLVSFVCRIEHVAMPMMGRYFRTTEACAGCGACEKLCPRGNISIQDGKPVFGHACVGCMACAFGCPQDAIRISVLDGWRVNGAYTFDAKAAEDGEVCDYCKKAYLRYFREAEAGTAFGGENFAREEFMDFHGYAQ